MHISLKQFNITKCSSRTFETTMTIANHNNGQKDLKQMHKGPTKVEQIHKQQQNMCSDAATCNSPDCIYSTQRKGAALTYQHQGEAGDLPPPPPQPGPCLLALPALLQVAQNR